MKPFTLVVTGVVGAIALTPLTATTAAAAVPEAAVLVSPADGSTSASGDISLSVRPSDPDGGQVQVTFEGRRKGATVPVAGSGSPFTVVALPDLQNYTYNNRQSTIVQQSQWVVSNRTALNTAMVVQLGDLVSEEENLTQWGHTSTGLKVLDGAGVPNTVVAGNHDFENVTGDHSQYDQFFPPARYLGASWTPSTARYGGYLGQSLFGTDPVNTNNMNNFALFTAGRRDFLVLNLEWEAPGYATDWAKKVLAAYPDRIAIMTTHAFVGINGTRRTTAERPGGVSANQLWTDFVSQQCQIKLVLSGHFHDGDTGEANRSDLNRCGEPVQQVLTDYQDRANGGDGWLRYYTFDPVVNTMSARTYSPKLGTFETDADSQFTVPFSLASTQPAPFQTIGTVTVDSGDVASTTWAGLDADADYEWRAITSDGQTSTNSPTWQVHTPTSAEVVDDTFTRNVSNGWGATAAGQAWQSTSTATAYAVDGSAGRIVAPIGSTRGVRMPSVSVADASIVTDLALSPVATGSGTYVSLHGRITGTASYRAKVRYQAGGSVNLSLIRYTGAEVSLASTTISGLTVTSGRYLRLKFELEGSSPTTLRAKVWPRDQAEPSTWTTTATDTTADLQGAGGLGIDVYVSSTATSAATATFDGYTVTRLGVVAPPVNQSPTAVIGAPVISERSVSVSGSGSSDADGTVASYAWDFGDGSSGSGVSASHSYAADGTFTVKLTVTDDDGATASATRQVTVQATPVNQSPTAVIGAPVISERSVSVSGSGSSDADGTVASYAWDFGDGSSGSGVSASHSYAADGTFTVKLTVTDDDGATASATRQVTVQATPPANANVAADDFGRTVSNGWGTATTGGVWTASSTASRYGVSRGTGNHILTTAGTTAETMLNSVSATNVDLRATLAWSRSAAQGTLYGTLVLRRQVNGSDYRVKVVVAANGTMQLVLASKVGSTETALRSATVSGVTQSADTQYRVAFRAVTSGGSTTLSAKLWRVGSTEPSAWAATVTDSTVQLQGSGSIGVNSYMSSSAVAAVTMRVDDLLAVVPN